jgi:hypothetical protein
MGWTDAELDEWVRQEKRREKRQARREWWADQRNVENIFLFVALALFWLGPGLAIINYLAGAMLR